eukprot:Awhi_evm1s7144
MSMIQNSNTINKHNNDNNTVNSNSHSNSNSNSNSLESYKAYRGSGVEYRDNINLLFPSIQYNGNNALEVDLEKIKQLKEVVQKQIEEKKKK